MRLILSTGFTMQKSVEPQPAAPSTMTATAFPVLVALSVAHLLNDMMQSLVSAIYPVIKDAHGLDFAQIGLITFTFQTAAFLFQPFIGWATDKRPQPYSMVAGMAFTLTGLVVLASASNFAVILAGAALIGTGSAIFHPEATRVARLASGGRQGLAQSLFQVGGQSGAALGPLLAAAIVVPKGQPSVAYFSLAALAAAAVLLWVGRWYAAHLAERTKPKAAGTSTAAAAVSPAGTPRAIAMAVAVLVILMFSKTAYTASLQSFYTFYLIEQFQVSVATSQTLLFVYLAAAAVGVLIGGPLGDKIGRRQIIWVSILGSLPFTLMLPFANLFWTVVLTVVIAIVMASAFAAILVYAMELLPGNVGLIAGLFYGLVFGLGGISAAGLGWLADHIGLAQVYMICAFLPALGLLAWVLPDIRPVRG